MKTMAYFSNKKKANEAVLDLIEKSKSSSDIDPDVILFYATLKYSGHYQEMLDILKLHFGDIPQIGASVDGMIFPHDMRTDGAVLVLGEDKAARIEVKSAREKGVLKSAEKLAKKIRCEKGVVLLHFPLVHVPDFKKCVEFWTKGKYYSFKAYRGNEKNKRNMARKFSEYCDRAKIFYLPPSILEIFAEQLDYAVPVVGINVLHTQMKFNSPSIFSNFKDIGNGIAALVIEKDDVEVVYDDIFPEKGVTKELTIENIKRSFNLINEYNAIFEKNVLISLDNKPPVKAVKELIGAREKDEIEMHKMFEKGNFNVQVPYFILFFNNKTNGFLNIGIDAYYPFEFFPLMVDLEDYSNLTFLTHEPMYGEMKDYISGLYSMKKTGNFKFFCIDVGSVSAFGNKVVNLKMEIDNFLGDNYFGILTSPASIFLPDELKQNNNITEIDTDIYWSCFGNNIFCGI